MNDFHRNEHVVSGLFAYVNEELSGDGLPFGDEPIVEGSGAEHPSWVYERDT